MKPFILGNKNGWSRLSMLNRMTLVVYWLFSISAALSLLSILDGAELLLAIFLAMILYGFAWIFLFVITGKKAWPADMGQEKIRLFLGTLKPKLSYVFLIFIVVVAALLGSPLGTKLRTTFNSPALSEVSAIDSKEVSTEKKTKQPKAVSFDDLIPAGRNEAANTGRFVPVDIKTIKLDSQTNNAPQQPALVKPRPSLDEIFGGQVETPQPQPASEPIAPQQSFETQSPPAMSERQELNMFRKMAADRAQQQNSPESYDDLPEGFVIDQPTKRN